MSTPLLGRDAVVLKGAVVIGYAKGVTVGIDHDLIKDYNLGSADPAVLEYGNTTFPVSIEKMYVDTTLFGSDILAKTKFSLEIRPQGTGAGKPKITLSNVVLTSWELTITQDGLIMEAVDGEATTLALGTQ